MPKSKGKNGLNLPMAVKGKHKHHTEPGNLRKTMTTHVKGAASEVKRATGKVKRAASKVKRAPGKVKRAASKVKRAAKDAKRAAKDTKRAALSKSAASSSKTGASSSKTGARSSKGAAPRGAARKPKSAASRSRTLVDLSEAEGCDGVCNIPGWLSVTADILTKVMYLQWMVMAPIFGYLTVSLARGSEEDWTLWALVVVFVLLLPLIPVLLIACCVNWEEVKLTVIRYRY